MNSSRLLMDANAIIDCHRFGCWRAICSAYKVETVKECFEECLRGANRTQRHPIKQAELEGQLSCKPHQVTEVMRSALALKLGNIAMDSGERDLMAYVLTQDAYALVVCSPDNALLRAAGRLALLDRVLSLEVIVERIGCGAMARKFDFKNTEKGLRTLKSKVLEFG